MSTILAQISLLFCAMVSALSKDSVDEMMLLGKNKATLVVTVNSQILARVLFS